MATTLEDHERRIAALEKAQTAAGENAIGRLERKLDAILPAVAGMIAESEKHVAERFDSLGAAVAGLRTETNRLGTEVVAAKDAMVDAMNMRFDEIMTKLDRLHNPPK